MSCIVSYVPLVKCLGGFLGRNCEVVLHDLRVPDKTIVAIENGHVSGRSVGGGASDMLLRTVKNHGKNGTEYVSNYRSTLQNGRSCRSSVYFIKDSHGELVGALCLNMDIDIQEECQDILTKWINPVIEGQKLVEKDEPESALGSGLEVFENLQSNIEEVQAQLIDRVAKDFQVPLDRLSPGERQEIVRRLNDYGLFLLKGGVAELSKRMRISEATVYRYLNKIKE